MAFIRNAATSFGTPTADLAEITHYTFWIGTVLWLIDDNDGTGDQTPNIGEEMTIPANMIDLEFPAGDFENAALVTFLQAALDNVTITARAHSAAPGASGTANEIASDGSDGYSRQTLDLTASAT